MKKLLLCITLLLPFILSANNNFLKTVKVEDDGFEWVLVYDLEGGCCGAETKKGKMLVPIAPEHETLVYLNGYLAVGKMLDDGSIKFGYYDKKGNLILDMNRYDMADILGGYDDEPIWFSVKSNGKVGICNDKGEELLAPTKYVNIIYTDSQYEGKLTEEGRYEAINLASVPVNPLADVYFGHMKQSNGFEWYQLISNKQYGFADKNKKPIVLPNRGYTYLMYAGTIGDKHIFEFEFGDYRGICDESGHEIISADKNYTNIILQKYSFAVRQSQAEGIVSFDGNEIISPSRGYDNIIYADWNDGYEWYLVEKNGLEGACDINGKELIKPMYASVSYDEDNGFECELKNGQKQVVNIQMDYSLRWLVSIFDEVYNMPDTDNSYKLEYYQELIKADIDNKIGSHPIAWNNMGIIYEQMKDFANAKKCYESALKVNPNYATAKENLKGLNSRMNGGNTKRSTMSKVIGTLNVLSTMYNTYNATNGGGYTGGDGAYSGGGSSSGSHSGSACRRCNGSGKCSSSSATADRYYCHGSGQCGYCNGSGIQHKMGQTITCPSCNGDGKCHYCNGSGVCSSCNGSGH